MDEQDIYCDHSHCPRARTAEWRVITCGILDEGPENLESPFLVAFGVVDIRSVEEEYASTGQMSLPVKGTTVRLSLEERELFAEGGRVLRAVNEHGELEEIGEIFARTFYGSVAGSKSSYATITLEPVHNELMGVVFVDGKRVNLISRPLSGSLVQIKSTWQEEFRQVPHWASVDSVAAASLKKNEQVGYYADPAFINYASNPSWSTRITNAVNYMHGMWYNDVDINLQIAGMTNTGTGFSSNVCHTHGEQFRNWLGSLYGGNAHTHQLLSGVDFIDCAGWAPGPMAFNSRFASSIVEAIDHQFGGYDPDETHHLAVVMAHENGHVNGAWHHDESRCESYFWNWCTKTTWSVMTSGTQQGYDIDSVGMWFDTYSQGEIRAHAHTYL